MKRKRPSYLHLKQRNLAYTRIYDADGKRQTIYLGEYDSPESHEAFHKILEDWLQSNARESTEQLTVADLLGVASRKPRGIDIDDPGGADTTNLLWPGCGRDRAVDPGFRVAEQHPGRVFFRQIHLVRVFRDHIGPRQIVQADDFSWQVRTVVETSLHLSIFDNTHQQQILEFRRLGRRGNSPISFRSISTCAWLSSRVFVD